MNSPTTQIHSHRLAAVRDRARDLGIDHVVVYSGEDMSYLTGERMDSHERLTALGVRFTQDPVAMGPVTTAVWLTSTRGFGWSRGGRNGTSHGVAVKRLR